MALALDPRPTGENWTYVLLEDRDKPEAEQSVWLFRDQSQADVEALFDARHPLGPPIGTLTYAEIVLGRLLIGVERFPVPFTRNGRGAASEQFLKQTRIETRYELADAATSRQGERDAAIAGKHGPSPGE